MAPLLLSPCPPPSGPLPRLPFADAITRYGSDKPDRRYGLPLADVGAALAACGHPVGLPAFQAVAGLSGLQGGVHAVSARVARTHARGCCSVVCVCVCVCVRVCVRVCVCVCVKGCHARLKP